jgi:hypothetical protein
MPTLMGVPVVFAADGPLVKALDFALVVLEEQAVNATARNSALSRHRSLRFITANHPSDLR